MATKIVTKNSSTASAVPTASDLVQGELAVNVADKRLFTEDNGGAIVEVGTNPSTLTVTGEITANGGIDVTGTATMDGLDVRNTSSPARIKVQRDDNTNSVDSASIDLLEGTGVNADFGVLGSFGYRLEVDGSTNKFNIKSGNGASVANRLSVERDTGDISFYEDTGTTPKLFWDASAESLGIGTSSPTKDLHISKAGQVGLRLTSSSFGADYSLLGSVSGTNAIGIYDHNATTYRMVMDSSGQVGIGTTSPSSKLSIHGSAGDAYLSQTNTSNSQRLEIGNAYSLITGGSGSVSAIASDNTLAFATSDTERMRILSTGGITFNGDTAQANALDDYEEGTWTPLLTAVSGTKTWTYSAQRGTYTKVGNLVTVFFNIQLTSNGSGTDGNARITGLPFASATDSALVSYYAFFWKQLIETGEVSLMGQLPAGGDYITFLDGSSSYPDISYINTSVFANDRRVRGSIQYRV